jgi:nondiscriminating aspartyl-tRNA synthetase
MQRTLIKDLRQSIGQQVKLQGWMQTLRDQKKMQFIILRDRTGLVQVALYKPDHVDLAEKVSSLTAESAITLTGTVVDNPVVKLGQLEVQLETLQIENLCPSQLPFDPFAETQPAIDFRLDWRFLDLRRPAARLVFEVATTAEKAMRTYWVEHNFMEIHTPKLMGSPSESGAELFELPYFDRKAYLAQSPQFYKQMAMAAGFEGVFEIGPVFRADPSFTARHMTEFTGIDMEMSWIESHDDVMASLEQLLHHAYKVVKETHGDQVKDVFGTEMVIPEVPFPRIPMAEAHAILKSRNYTLPADKKGDLDPGGERELGQYVKEKFNNDFAYITDWPINVRPFYHMRHPDNPNLTRSFDLLATGLEIVTGAQREHRFEPLTQQALEKGLHLEPIQFYLDFFKFGCPPHGGFGMGLSRLLMVMLGLPNIREAVFLFRGPTRLQP